MSEDNDLVQLENELRSKELYTIITYNRDKEFGLDTFFDRISGLQTRNMFDLPDESFSTLPQTMWFATINWDLSTPGNEGYSHCCGLIFDFTHLPIVDIEFYDPRGKNNQTYGGRETYVTLINAVIRKSFKSFRLSRRISGLDPLQFRIDYMSYFEDFYSHLDSNLESTANCRYETFKYIYDRVITKKKKGYDNSLVVAKNKQSVLDFVESDKNENTLTIYVPLAIREDVAARKLNKEFAGLEDTDFLPRKLRFI
mgnify:CR=1 FL=1|jgi:hypothetical protein